MACITLPKKIYFKQGCLPVALDELKGMKKAFIIGNLTAVESKLNELNIQHIQYSGMADKLMEEIRLFEPDVIISVNGEKMFCALAECSAYKISVGCMDMSADMVIIDRSDNLPSLETALKEMFA